MVGGLENAPSPVQFVWADGDPIAHVEMGRELGRRCPKAVYHALPELGHFLLIEDPAGVAERIEQFVALEGRGYLAGVPAAVTPRWASATARVPWGSGGGATRAASSAGIAPTKWLILSRSASRC